MVPLGITGSSGRLGGRVARRLSREGREQRLLLRTPEKAPQLSGATAVRSSYDEPGVGLEGIETLFMVSAAEDPRRVEQHKHFLDAAAAAGVQHVVYTSFLGASPDATFLLARDHWATEEHLRALGLASTVLRNSLYADFVPLLAGEDGVIRGPAGDGSVAPVAIDDVADAVAAVLLDPASHRGRTYRLTGPASMSLTVAAEILSSAGTLTTFEDETVEQAYASRSSYGAPAWEVDGWVSTYLAIKDGSLDEVTSDVELLTGHGPRTLASILS